MHPFSLNDKILPHMESSEEKSLHLVQVELLDNYNSAAINLIILLLIAKELCCRFSATF